MTEWYIRIDGEEIGPMDAKRLKNLADTGRISRATLIRTGNNDRWVSAANVKGLFVGESPQAEFNVSPKTLQNAAMACQSARITGQ